MSATNAPFGLRPAFHPSGLDRAQALAGGIASGLASNILKGQAVKYVASGGVITPVTGTEAFNGAFAGVEFTDTTGRRRVSNYWPASTAYQAGSCIAYFYNDSNIVYEIQANGAIAQTSIGNEANLTTAVLAAAETHLYEVWLAEDVLTRIMQAKEEVNDAPKYKVGLTPAHIANTALNTISNTAYNTVTTNTNTAQYVERAYQMELAKYKMELEKQRQQDNEHAMRTAKSFKPFI
jgi:hypothetical protein